MPEIVNLLVDLRDPQFDGPALGAAMRAIERAGMRVERATTAPDAYLAWIDDEFGGAWSSEAFLGKNIIVSSDEGYAGFATHDCRGIDYAWLRGLGARSDVGIFGPFGVAAAYRGSPIGPNLLVATLATLREAGYARALIPAVGGEKLIAYYVKHSGAQIAERFDTRQWRDRRYRTVVMVSGGGTNLQSVVDGVASGSLPLEIAAVVSNRGGAYALQRARDAGIADITLEWDRATQSRGVYDARLLERVKREEPQLVLLLGWMHLLSDEFVAAFPNAINIHPAFLPLDQTRDEVAFPDGSVTPAFRGPRAVRDALVWGSRWIGATAHRVTLEGDRGPVLVRKPFELLASEGEEAATTRLHPVEHHVLHGAIMRWVYER